jgi:murein DD-endopeptidase MepM/ murein hydrolase activator NlpD
VRADGKGHDGIDLAAAPRDMVRAAASGTVSGIAQHDPRLGRKVTIDHGGGWKTVYGHLDAVTVAMGDVIKTGERIGLAGRSGDADRTELHFAILRNGKPVDPAGKIAR